MEWKFRIISEIRCWYAYGFAFEIEYSHVFHGIYFKLAHSEFHIGWWKGDTWKKYINNLR